jgi:hypothetical protein
MGANKLATGDICFEINRAHGALLPRFRANDKVPETPAAHLFFWPHSLRAGGLIPAYG